MNAHQQAETFGAIKTTHLEPLHGLFLRDTMRSANLALAALASLDAITFASQNYEEVHAIDTDGWIILDAEINVLVNAETKIASVGEVGTLQLVFLHAQGKLQDFLRLRTSHRAVARNLLITTNTKGTNGKACCNATISHTSNSRKLAYPWT